MFSLPYELTNHLIYFIDSTGNTRRRCLRFPGDIATPQIDTMTPNTSRKFVRIQKASISKLRSNVRTLNQSLRRAKKKIKNLEQIVKELQSDRFKLNEVAMERITVNYPQKLP